MDNSHLFSDIENAQFDAKKPLERRVMLPDYLSIKEICDLLFPFPNSDTEPVDKSKVCEWRADHEEKKEINIRYKDKLINACRNGKLTFEGEIDGWDYWSTNIKHPLARRGSCGLFISEPRTVQYFCTVDDCTIHKEVFKSYLQCIKAWPINGDLDRWWTDDIGEALNNYQVKQIPLKNKGDLERDSQLHDLIWRVHQYLERHDEKTTAQAVWNEIIKNYTQHDVDKVIQEATADVIFWQSGYGNEQSIKRTSFDSTLSTIRKKHLSS